MYAKVANEATSSNSMPEANAKSQQHRGNNANMKLIFET